MTVTFQIESDSTRLKVGQDLCVLAGISCAYRAWLCVEMWFLCNALVNCKNIDINNENLHCFGKIFIEMRNILYFFIWNYVYHDQCRVHRTVDLECRNGIMRPGNATTSQRIKSLRKNLERASHLYIITRAHDSACMTCTWIQFGTAERTVDFALKFEVNCRVALLGPWPAIPTA